MARVLLTGVAGFIGHKTCELLLEQGHEVVGIDNINDYYDTKIKDFRLEVLKAQPGFQFYKVDIEDKDGLKSVFDSHKGIDVIMNLAARAGVRYSLVNPDIYVSTNTQGNLNLLELAKEHKIEKYVMASTSSLYAGMETPFVESLDVRRPISPYASTKLGAEAMCYTYHHLYGIDVSVVRYFTVYGPLSRPDMAQFRFMRWIADEKKIELFGDGEQARDFTHVSDIARGTILAMKKLGFEIINLGGGNNPISVNMMIKSFEKLLGKTAKINHLPFNKADMQVTWADITKAKQLLDWRPEISFEHGIEDCVKHYRLMEEFYKSVGF